ncbi:MAG: hypothetical protein WCO84_05235 [bacterium]
MPKNTKVTIFFDKEVEPDVFLKKCKEEFRIVVGKEMDVRHIDKIEKGYVRFNTGVYFGRFRNFRLFYVDDQSNDVIFFPIGGVSSKCIVRS